MLTQRWRPVFFSILAVVGIWAVALTGYRFAKNARMTAEKVQAFAQGTDLSKLSAEERGKAIRRLAEMLNALSIQERQRARLQRAAWGWFNVMTEEEKAGFIDATMPTGFKQMLASFEQMPDDKRRHAVDDALRRLRESQTKMQALDNNGTADTNGPPILSKELEAKVRTLGLKAFYSQSSAQTKAELAPVLEELQRVMESGRPFRMR